MHYQSFNPSPALRPFVERYCLIEQDESESCNDLMPPGGFSGLMLNLGDEYHVRTPDGPVALPRCGMGGQLPQAMPLRAPARTSVLLIMFRPAGIHRAFGLSMPTITNRIVAGNDVVDWPLRRDWCDLPERLMDVTDPAGRVQVVDQELLKRFGRCQPQSSWVDDALYQLTHLPTDYTVGQLSANLRVRRRQLTRRFTQEIGVSPKTYARVMRFRRLFQSVLTRPQRRWHDLIDEGGWYDQAHFIKDLYALTGQTPSAFFGHYHATPDFMLND